MQMWKQPAPQTNESGGQEKSKTAQTSEQGRAEPLQRMRGGAGSFSARELLQMQQVYGNRATTRMLSGLRQQAGPQVASRSAEVVQRSIRIEDEDKEYSRDTLSDLAIEVRKHSLLLKLLDSRSAQLGVSIDQVLTRFDFQNRRFANLDHLVEEMVKEEEMRETVAEDPKGKQIASLVEALDAFRKSEQERAEVSDEGAEAQEGVSRTEVPRSEVPKLIHFVWLGGPIGESRMNKINQWHGLNSGNGWKTIVWIDPNLLTSNTIRSFKKELVQLNILPKEGMQPELVGERDRQQTGTIEHAVAPQSGWSDAYKRTKGEEDPLIGYQPASDYSMNMLYALMDEKIKQRGGYARFLKTDEQKLLESITKRANERIQEAFRDIAALRKTGVKVLDITSGMPVEVQKWYNWETRLGWTNYGAASDLGRLAILEQLGGVYLDVDLEAVSPLDDLYTIREMPRIGPLIDDTVVEREVQGAQNPSRQNQAQLIQALISRIESDPNHSFNNNVIASAPNGWFIQEYLQTALGNYEKSSKRSDFMEMHWGDDPENIKLSTVKTTGPHVIEGILMNFGNAPELRQQIKFPSGKVGWITDITSSRDWIT